MTEVLVQVAARHFVLLDEAADGRRTDHGKPFASEPALYLIGAPFVRNIFSNHWLNISR